MTSSLLQRHPLLQHSLLNSLNQHNQHNLFLHLVLRCKLKFVSLLIFLFSFSFFFFGFIFYGCFRSEVRSAKRERHSVHVRRTCTAAFRATARNESDDEHELHSSADDANDADDADDDGATAKPEHEHESDDGTAKPTNESNDDESTKPSDEPNDDEPAKPSNEPNDDEPAKPSNEHEPNDPATANTTNGNGNGNASSTSAGTADPRTAEARPVQFSLVHHEPGLHVFVAHAPHRHHRPSQCSRRRRRLRARRRTPSSFELPRPCLPRPPTAAARAQTAEYAPSLAERCPRLQPFVKY